jgi:hypothetical protein
MTVNGSDLLRKLGGASTPGGAPASAGGQASGIDFAKLLQQARDGALDSGLEVEIDEGSGVKLNDDQIARLRTAADRAQAEGLSTALVMIDGMGLMMDVGARRVMSRVDMTKLTALSGIDGVVNAPLSAGAPVAESAADPAEGSFSAGNELTRSQMLQRLGSIASRMV